MSRVRCLLPPNPPFQPTAARARSGYFGGFSCSARAAAERQAVGRALRSGVLDCPSNQHAIASCSLACESSSHLPTSPQRHRVMLIRVRKLITHADLAATPYRTCSLVCETPSPMPIAAQRHRAMPNSSAQRHRSCSSQRGVIAPWPITYERPSHLPTSPQRCRSMPCSRAERGRAAIRPAQQARVADAAARPRDRAHFESRFRLNSQLDLSVRRS